jgi:hypothetical protein
VSNQNREKTTKEGLSSLNINGILMDNQQAIAHIFNNYFSITTEEIMGINRTDKISQLNNTHQDVLS